MNKVEQLNQLVADLSVAYVKLHNLHWNVTGRQFKSVHEFVEEVYEDLDEQYDEVAERIKMLGGFPAASVKKYLEMTKIEELPDEDVATEDVYQILLDTLKYLRDLATDARNTADEEGDFSTVAMLEDAVAVYDKHVWFIEQALK
ncbi:MAG: Dps family protein [Bacillota bacterium]